MTRPLTQLLDRVAIGLSGLCLVHCLAGGILLGLFAISGSWLSHNVHAVGLALAMPIAAVALWRGVRRHGRALVGLLGIAGLALMAASLFVAHGGPLEVAVSIAGVSLLGLAHWWNLRASSL